MDATMIQMRSMPSVGQTLRGLLGGSQGTAQNGDFAALLALLVGGGKDESGIMNTLFGNSESSDFTKMNDIAALADLKALGGLDGIYGDGTSLNEVGGEFSYLPMMRKMLKIVEKDGEENGAALLAELIAAGSIQPGIIENLTPEQISALSGENAMSKIDALLKPNSGLSNLAAAFNISQDKSQANSQEFPPIIDFQNTLNENAKNLAQEPLQSEIPFGQMRYQGAIHQVQRNLKNSAKAEESEAIDIEALQAEVDRKRFIPEGIKVDNVNDILKEEPIARQISTKILENLGKTDEFVMKLKPEGLGEITVKIVEANDKMILTISASSSETAKMLNQEASALQNTLKPMNVEVREILAVTDYAAASGAFDFAGGQPERGKHFSDSNQAFNFAGANNDGEIEAIDLVSAATQNSALDSYI